MKSKRTFARTTADTVIRQIVAATVLIVIGAGASMSRADVIVLKSGTRITTTRHWEEGDQVKFVIQGLETGVPKSQILRIEKDDQGPSADEKKPQQPATDSPSAPPAFSRQQARPPSAPTAAAQPQPDMKTDALPSTLDPEEDSKNSSERTPLTKIVQLIPKGRHATGFRSLYWGMPEDEIPALVPVESDPELGGLLQYVVPDEHLRYGNAPVDRILYGFRDHQLLTISFWVKGRKAYDRLRDEIFQTIGTGNRNRDGLERTIWPGGPTDRMLEFNAENKTGLFWMRSHHLWNRQEVD